jgi:hypothetical protein
VYRFLKTHIDNYKIFSHVFRHSCAIVVADTRPRLTSHKGGMPYGRARGGSALAERECLITDQDRITVHTTHTRQNAITGDMPCRRDGSHAFLA